MEVNTQKLDQFMGKVLGEVGAALNSTLILLGDKLGLYKAMADSMPTTPEALAKKTGTAERYVREWMAAQAAGGFVEYDAASQTYTLPPEQALALAVDDSPAFIGGFFQVVQGLMIDEPRLLEAFRTGEGVGWDEHHPCLFHGTERLFRPGYIANLTTSWIPSLDGAEARLKAGAKVADVGCGHGASTVVMARAYPNSKFYGYDYHSGSIEHARKAATDAGVADRCVFEVSSAKSFPGSGYDMVTCFDCLHDMGDPVGASAHMRSVLRPDGWLMIVEPFAHDELEKNLNPVGRIFYAASTMVCTPASKAQEVGLALGAQAGEKRLREVVQKGGFSRFRRATETPFNMVLEARP